MPKKQDSNNILIKLQRLSFLPKILSSEKYNS